MTLFKKEYLIQNGIPNDWDAIDNAKGEVIYDKVIDNSRWSVIHEIVFKLDDKFYLTHYSVGATECQEERPWEYEDDIRCVEVVEKEVLVKKYVPV